MRNLKALKGISPLSNEMQKSILGGKHGADDYLKGTEHPNGDDKGGNHANDDKHRKGGKKK